MSAAHYTLTMPIEPKRTFTAVSTADLLQRVELPDHLDDSTLFDSEGIDELSLTNVTVDTLLDYALGTYTWDYIHDSGDDETKIIVFELPECEEFIVDGRFTDEGISVSAYGNDGATVRDETWFTWDEAQERSETSDSDFTFELEPEYI